MGQTFEVHTCPPGEDECEIRRTKYGWILDGEEYTYSIMFCPYCGKDLNATPETPKAKR